MSGKKVKGIVVELGGDVTGLNKAIKSVSSEARDTQSELKKIERLLKMDPSNVTLLKQKQELLNQSIGKTEDVVKALKEAKAKADQDMANGTEINEQAYRELERQIEANEIKLRDTKEEAKQVHNAIQKIGGNPIRDVADASESAEDKLDKLKAKAGKVADVLKSTFAGAVKIVGSAVGIAAGGVAALTKQAIENYAEYEQLVGGVETLFGANADAVKKYASDAYKTAGISANAYMETATSFSASLIQSLGGDTAAAAKVADQAITDMSDNANKMGTSIDMIQNAYQGFAKQNYTMLDNLKLGYGGTKEEMERLIADANAVKNANGEMADLSIESFADIVEAIHIMQDEMGIAGATAAEAEGTITGSIAMTKAAWSNLVTGVADDNADFEKLVSDFVDSVGITAKNIVPRVQVALEGAAQLVETMIPIIIDMIPSIVGEWLPNILQSGVGIIQALLKGIMDNHGLVTKTAVQTVSTLLNSFVSMLPDLLVTGALMLGELTLGLLEAVPGLIEQIPSIISSIASTFSANSGIFLEIGQSIVVAIWEGIKSLWRSLVENFSGLWSSLSMSQSYQVTGTIPMMANGGTLLSGSAIVGEAGPELLTVDGGKAVVQPLTVNTSKMENLLGSINGQLGHRSEPTTLVTYVTLDGAVVGKAAVEYIRQEDRANGR